MNILKLLFIPLLLSSTVCFAEQKIQQGDYQVHYSVFPSNIISSEVAAIYKIKRSAYRGLVNITPQKIIDKHNNTGIKARVIGKARNLIGNTQELEFKEIVEGDVIYYLAEFSFSNEETFTFTIEVTPILDTKIIIPIKLQQKFYVD